MIDGEKLLEWADTQVYDHQNVWFEWSRVVKMDKLKKKIQSLMSEATTEEISTVEPSAWQVGDRVLTDCETMTIVNHVYDDKCIVQDCYLDSTEETDIFIYEMKMYRNIDAERRALQAEIDRLNSKIDEMNGSLQDCILSYPLPTEDKNIYERALKAQELKLSGIELFDYIYEGRGKVEQSVDVDPWRYDLEKAPKDVPFLVTDGTLFYACLYDEGYTAIFPTVHLSDAHKKLKDAFSFTDIIAWMLIPEPKGGV